MVKLVDETDGKASSYLEEEPRDEKRERVRDLALKFFSGCEVMDNPLWVSVHSQGGAVAVIFYPVDSMRLRDPRYLGVAGEFARAYEAELLHGDASQSWLGRLAHWVTRKPRREFIIRTDYGGRAQEQPAA